MIAGSRGKTATTWSHIFSTKFVCIFIFYTTACTLRPLVGMFSKMLISSIFIFVCDITKVEYPLIICLVLNEDKDGVSKLFVSGFNDILWCWMKIYPCKTSEGIKLLGTAS
jgi:hypothetical protein